MTNVTCTTKEQERYTPTSKELLELVKASQNGDDKAKEKLCTYFKPLVEASARSYSIYEVLGEDGLSIAWLIFLECLETIDLSKKEKLTPGYFKLAVTSRLVSAVEDMYRFSNYHVSLEATNTEFVKQSFEEEIVNDAVLRDALLTLKDQEKEFIYWHYFAERTLPEMAAAQGKKLVALCSRRYRILKKLREAYFGKQTDTSE